jgi:hypothetical protein
MLIPAQVKQTSIRLERENDKNSIITVVQNVICLNVTLLNVICNFAIMLFW